MSAPYPWYAKYTIALAGGVLTIYAMIVAKSALIPLLFAGFLAILLAPVSSWMERYGMPRIVSSLLAMLVATMALVGIGFFFYTQFASFVEDADRIRARSEEMLAGVEPLLATWLGVEDLIDLSTIGNTVAEYISDNAADLARGLAGAAGTITAVFLVPVFIFFFLISRSFLRTFLLQIFGRGDHARTRQVSAILGKVKSVVQHYITGMLIVIAILAFLNSILLLTIGVEHAVFFAVFAALLNVIPFLGPILGSFLPILYALLTMDSLIYPVLILGGFYVIQLFESNLFTPTIVGSQVSMNAMVTLFLLFAGAQIWGLAGMILFIPLGAILKVVCDEVESLKPFGFLLGRMPTYSEREKGPLARRISEIPSRIDAKREQSSHTKEDASGPDRANTTSHSDDDAQHQRHNQHQTGTAEGPSKERASEEAPESP